MLGKMPEYVLLPNQCVSLKPVMIFKRIEEYCQSRMMDSGNSAI